MSESEGLFPFAPRPLLLDLFCGAGGCAKGYELAGFNTIGVDVKPQPNYPGVFIQDDAIEILRWLVNGGEHSFDAIHASPPCQKFTSFNVLHRHRKTYEDLLTPTRELLEQTGLPWIIENVPGAPMRPDYVLCGSQFGLGVRRHRWFETSWHGFDMALTCDHSRPTVCVVGHGGGGSGKGTKVKRWTKADGAEAMGIDWMSRDELAQAIPPAYTEYLGRRLLGQIAAVAA